MARCLPTTHLTHWGWQGEPGAWAEVEPARPGDGQPCHYYSLQREELGCLAGLARGEDNSQSLLSAFPCYYLSVLAATLQDRNPDRYYALLHGRKSGLEEV